MEIMLSHDELQISYTNGSIYIRNHGQDNVINPKVCIFVEEIDEVIEVLKKCKQKYIEEHKIKSFDQILQEGTWLIKPKYKQEALKKIDELEEWFSDKFGDDGIGDAFSSLRNELEGITQDNWVAKYQCSKCDQASENGIRMIRKGKEFWICRDCIEEKFENV